MGAIRVHEFTTLDGVIGTPTWTMGYPFDPKMGEAIGGIMGGSEGLLLGRTTFEMFAPAWSQRTEAEDPGAPFMNGSRKYVVGAKPPAVEWNNSEPIGPYEPKTIRELKERVPGDLYVSGSGTLVRAMLADGLVDALHLFVYPVSLGTGPRLFPDGGATTKLELLSCEAFTGGVVHLAYAPASA